MATKLSSVLRFQPLRLACVRAMSGGQFGDGAGKGGGSGGSVRDAGGSFGKMEAAKEEQYFRQLQKEQLDKMKDMLEDEVTHHERQIRQHQEAIDHHKKRIGRLAKQSGSDSD
ncbi:ATPase inhibitor mai-1, mitochondrial [Aplysia californica]|uniref:ATPase inhibitor mai-1, mitochondrial n=1 Tax=Aplysia californica TaxID=6500 RepID=A0ABM0JDV1_APLCA|nr:ATPase inhibitor mai-1, mitochondrial [Aplysia californica]